MTSHPLSQLVAYKQWADRGLYHVAGESLQRLGAQDASLLLRVLDHMHVVDRIFRHHLQELPHAYKAAQSERLPEFDDLATSALEAGDWYVAYVAGLTESDVAQPVDFTFTSGKRARMTRGEILLHVCMHGQYHRGNAGALLQLRGLTPARDGFTDFIEQAIAANAPG